MSRARTKYRTADWEERELLISISRTSPYTTGFSNTMFSGEAAFQKGWIGVAERVGRRPVGFVCLRHKIREPITVIYDVAVLPKFQGRGIGLGLCRWALESGPHETLRLNVDDRNAQALDFYRHVGFVRIGTGAWGKGAQLRPYTTLSVTLSTLKEVGT